MKKLSTLFSCALLCFLVARVERAEAQDLFHAGELSGDFFGFYGSKDKGGADKSAWGAGIGVNYFLTERIGFGADTYADAFTVPYLLNASVMYRYPIQEWRLAPYAIAGFGRQWEHGAQWTGHFGGGADYRLKDMTSVFAEIRGVFPETTGDYAVFRFGFRFIFH